MIAQYERIALIPEHPNYGPTLLGPLTIPSDLESQGVLPPLPQPIMIEELRALPLSRLDTLRLSNATPLTAIQELLLPATHIRLGSPEGLAPESESELFDPLKPDQVIGAPLRVAAIEQLGNPLITLSGAGLSAVQFNVGKNAIAAGKFLLARPRGFRPDQRALTGGTEGLAQL